MNEDSFWEMLDKLSDILQIANYELLLKDASNNDLMKYLQHQDSDILSTIIKQNETIIEQNNEIITLLRKE